MLNCRSWCISQLHIDLRGQPKHRQAAGVAAVAQCRDAHRGIFQEETNYLAAARSDGEVMHVKRTIVVHLAPLNGDDGEK